MYNYKHKAKTLIFLKMCLFLRSKDTDLYLYFALPGTKERNMPQSKYLLIITDLMNGWLNFLSYLIQFSTPVFKKKKKKS